MAYDLNGQRIDIAPADPAVFEQCKPIYERIEGWQATTASVRDYQALPEKAVAYLKRLETLLGVNIDMISTSPDRNDTIILKDLVNS